MKGGASLINDRWAVTAAHVVETIKKDGLRLYGGLVNENSGLGNSIVMESENIIIHPNYATNIEHRTNYDNDIALIKMSAKVNLGPNLIPICLPTANVSLVENEIGTVSGWGMTDHNGRMVSSHSLKYAHISVYSLAKCRDTPFLLRNKRMVFTDNMFCAGAEGMDSCRQDSGGPFTSPMLGNGKGPFYLTGIVSWGPPCYKREFNGYYTKVENYVDWIKKTIQENS